MKTCEQLAESAYLAYQKQARIGDDVTPAFSSLSAERQSCWMAAVKQVAAEIAALH